jgi:tetratricopeptide (TPR) repeat protein
MISLYYTAQGGVLQEIKYAENAFEEAEKVQDVESMAAAGVGVFNYWAITGEFFKIVEAVPQVLSLLEETHTESESFGTPQNTYSSLLALCGFAMGFLGNFEEGEALCEKGLRFAHKINNLYSLAPIEFFYGWLYVAKGDGKNTVEHFQNSIGYAEETQYTLLLGLAWNGLGWGYYYLGELETARKHAEKGIKIQSEAGVPFLLSAAYLALSLVHFDSGDLKSAQSCIGEALKLAQNNNEKYVEGLSRVMLGVCPSKGWVTSS